MFTKRITKLLNTSKQASDDIAKVTSKESYEDLLSKAKRKPGQEYRVRQIVDCIMINKETHLLVKKYGYKRADTTYQPA